MCHLPSQPHQMASSQLLQTTASYGERGSASTLSHRHQTYGYHRIRKNHNTGLVAPQDHSEDKFFNNNNNNMARGAKLSTKLGGRRQQQAQKLHRLGFSYLASSLLYIVTKVKAFYNGFLGDVGNNDPRTMVMEAPMTEAYFSVPVILPN